MTRHKTPHPQAPGHVLVPASAIGGLSLVLAAGLAALGVIERANEGIARLVGRKRAGAEDGEHGVARHADVELPDLVFADEIGGAAGGEGGECSEHHAMRQCDECFVHDQNY